MSGEFGVFNDFFELFFFYAGMIVEHISLMTLKDFLKSTQAQIYTYAVINIFLNVP